MNSITENESLNNELGIYAYLEKGFVRVNGTKEKPWFNAKDIATILGYVNTRKAIRDNVDIEDKNSREKLGELGEPPNNSSHNSVWINESGLYSLILRSRKDEAKRFKRWVTSIVLPSIRKNGSYTLPTPQRTQQQIQLDIIDQGTELLKKLGCYNDRDRILFGDLTRNLTLNNGNQIGYIKKEVEEWAVSRRLSEYFGVNSKKEHQKCSGFGKVLKQKYKDVYNENPPKRTQYVDGTNRSVFCYYNDFWEDHGDALMMEYWNLEWDDEE